MRRVTGNFTVAVVPPWRVTVTRLMRTDSGWVSARRPAPVTVTVLVAVTVAAEVVAECTGVSANASVPPLFSAAPLVMPKP